MGYFFCDICKRYYLDVFREWHYKKHTYMYHEKKMIINGKKST